jgi:hypothetical protein
MQSSVLLCNLVFTASSSNARSEAREGEAWRGERKGDEAQPGSAWLGADKTPLSTAVVQSRSSRFLHFNSSCVGKIRHNINEHCFGKVKLLLPTTHSKGIKPGIESHY